MGTRRVIKEFLTYRNPGPLNLPKGKGFGHPTDTHIVLPSWLFEDAVNYYAAKFDKIGFTGGINYYRNFDLNWELTAPWTGAQVKIPVKFVVGDQNLVYKSLGVEDFIHKGGFKKFVPFLEEVVMLEGVAHFIQQEKPDEISKHIHDFIKKFH
ncbi:hypothetical protein TB2_021481 [Malus domestica]